MKKQVIVDHIPLRVKPCYESKTLSDSVKYRDILHGKKIIYNESDFDYLELIWKNKTVYLPTEYLIDYSASTLSNKQPGLPINEENPLPVDFIPEDLREVPGEACRQNSSILLTNETLTQFLAMREAAKNDNIHIYLLKGYLDIAELAKSYRQDYESVFMQNMTEKPACSAHHLGTVLNLTSPEINYRQHPLFCLTEAYNWLSRNAGNFGFFFTTNFESFLQRKNSWKPWQMIYLPYEKSESLPKNDNIPEDCALLTCSNSLLLYTKKVSQNNLKYLFIHDNEHSARRVCRDSLAKHGGTLYEIINNQYRHLFIPVGNYLLEYDPNRIFTEKGLRENLLWLNPDCPANIIEIGLKDIARVKNYLLEKIQLNRDEALISIHTNNKLGNLSVKYFMDQSMTQSFEVSQSHRENPKDFIYVIYHKDFEYFANLGYNVVYQKENLLCDDGSLSIWMSRNKMTYFTLEVCEGNYSRQLEMADDVIKYIKYNN